MSGFYQQPTTPLPQSESGSLLPERIGPYRIESLVSATKESLLYCAMDEEKGQLVMIKLLSNDQRLDPKRKKRFLQEVSLLKSLSHPNIASFYSEGEWKGSFYLTMEFVRGVSLKQFILQRSLSLKKSIDIILQAAYAILYLHSQGIVHRDLKPENLLITESSQVKIIDFGISISIHEEIEAPSIGTPSYMAPELFIDLSKSTSQSDIYSLGVIFYELLLGRISFGKVELSLVPAHLKEIVAKATAKDLSKRYADLVDFIADLSLYLKQNLVREDQSVEDLLKEQIDGYEKAKGNLLKTAPLDLGGVEIEVALRHGALPVCLVKEKLKDGSFVLLMASSAENSIEALLELQHLKTAAELLLIELQKEKSLSLSNYLSSLEAKVHHCVSLVLLHIDPHSQQYRLFHCGSIFFYHVRRSLLMHPVHVERPYFGSKKASLKEHIMDRYDSKDILLLPAPGYPLEEVKITPMPLALLLDSLVQGETSLLLGVQFP